MHTLHSAHIIHCTCNCNCVKSKCHPVLNIFRFKLGIVIENLQGDTAKNDENVYTVHNCRYIEWKTG